MRRFLLAGIVLAAFAVSGASCGNKDGSISPAETVLLGCDAFASALITVSGLNNEGKLSDGTVKIVDNARATVNPICEGQAPDVDSTVKDVAIDAGTRSLLAIAAQFGR